MLTSFPLLDIAGIYWYDTSGNPRSYRPLAGCCPTLKIYHRAGGGETGNYPEMLQLPVGDSVTWG